MKFVKVQRKEKYLFFFPGFDDKEECDEWPVEKCSVEQKLVKKFTPQTGCEKVKREMCAPPGCGLVEVRYIHMNHKNEPL